MYIVNLINNGIPTEIHGKKQKLKSGSVVKGINAIDSFSFAMMPDNKGFNRVADLKALVTVYNTNKKRYEFYGRVIHSQNDMDANGMITKECTCESYLGFLCDSQQKYVVEQNWTVQGLLEHIINTHNAKVEDYKKFTIGEVTVTDPNDNLYIGIQRENTWKTIEEKLIKTLGGEIRFRVVDGVNYLDYLTEIGGTKATPIKLSHNMQKITQEKDPTAYITRLIPYGCKLTKTETTTDEEGNEVINEVETEERLDITSVNDGVEYIEDTTALEAFGIIEGIIEFDDVTEASNLKRKGEEWLIANNKVLVKYSITALDLSLIGLDIDDFDVCNRHPVENALLGIDDTVRIIKKTIDVVNDNTSSSIEAGDNFKTLSDMQIEQQEKMDGVTETIGKIESDYTTNQKLKDEVNLLSSLIKQMADEILLTVEKNYTINEDEYKEYVSSELSLLSDSLTATFSKEITETIEDYDGSVTTKFEEIKKYIKMSDNGITIQSSDSEIQLQLDNEDGIVFTKNGVTLGYWDGENFYCGNIYVRVDERARFGNFAFVPRSDGSLMFLKVGD